MKSNPSSNNTSPHADAGSKIGDVESLAMILDSCSIEALKMVLLILRAQQNKTGLGT